MEFKYEEEVPKSATTVKNRVLEQARLIKDDIKKELKKSENIGLIFDEWISRPSRRYLNVIARTTKEFNLGVIEVHGSANAHYTLIIYPFKCKKIHFGNRLPVEPKNCKSRGLLSLAPFL